LLSVGKLSWKFFKENNMLYSPDKKRKIILDNYSQPSQQIELVELEKKSVE